LHLKVLCTFGGFFFAFNFPQFGLKMLLNRNNSVCSGGIPEIVVLKYVKSHHGSAVAAFLCPILCSRRLGKGLGIKKPSTRVEGDLM
jgi:hypothetical protein